MAAAGVIVFFCACDLPILVTPSGFTLRALVRLSA